MTIDPQQFERLLSAFDLEALFNELGWDYPVMGPQQVLADGEAFTLTPVAQKRGVAVFRCSPDGAGRVPPRPQLLRIEQEAAKISHEHLLVFADAAQSMQTWLWVMRAPGQPSVTRTHSWHRGQSAEALRQKLSHVVWSLDEEEAVTLTDVIAGLKRAFDRDRVSKQFYERFKAEHQTFAGFIEGLAKAAEGDRAWYASLMLNRLMFVYFIQRKGFLDGNPDYLRQRLRRLQAEAGSGHFHSFYRLFLRRLFHEGLGQPASARAADLGALIGRVPYLNGGLFALHELEETHPEIDIPDPAFERLFDFFDAYEWHLDDRPLATGREINPDVLGYIFEKYINQKQMGAYYTKEDITGYICKNTVIPHLLGESRRQCREAFTGPVAVWGLLAADPDRYLYPAMRTGVIDAAGALVPESDLPDFVQAGMRDPNARMFERRYNLGEALFHTATGERGTLPTETWREYVDRRNRCLEVRERLTAGEVQAIDDLITLNLDIRQFMQDLIDRCDSPVLLRAVWHAVVGRVPERSHEHFRHGIAILDPTCGSGAFLFAALNILEPVYEACLDRMEGFNEDAALLGRPADPEFARILAEVARHPSRRYYVYKTIILNNLFGVDIMAEAVEICKLRLFLKLVSQVQSERELEPLPDMDFNIRCGNTLVGYATEAQFDEASRFFNSAHRVEIKARTADLADAFEGFRGQQTAYGGTVSADDKARLRGQLAGLSLELDRYLARDYGVDPDQDRAFNAWRASHQPFHWFAEFYGVMRAGGFDVVVGNPPYVELKDLIGDYRVRGYSTESCGNLYALCSERALALAHKSLGRFGFIIPVASTCTDGYATLKSHFLKTGRCYISSFNDRPGRLFDGLEHIRLSIVIIALGESGAATTKYNKWNTIARDTLFPTLQYQISEPHYHWTGAIPKLGTPLEPALLKLIHKGALPIGATAKAGKKCPIYYTRKLSGFVQILDFIPSIVDENGAQRQPSELKEVRFSTDESAAVALALLNSSLFYWFLTIYSDVRNLNKREVQGFPVAATQEKLRRDLALLARRLMSSLRETSKVITMRYKKQGALSIQCIFPKLSKAIIDEIDLAYGRALNLDDETLDFVINYDIKYRMSGTESED